MNPLILLLAVSVFLSGLTSTAADAATASVPGTNTATGNWRWTLVMPDGSKAEPRAKLKQEGALLTGVSVPRYGEESSIVEGKVGSEDVSWTVIREQEGRRVTTRYRGRVSGDVLVGEIHSDWAGEIRRYDWKARREATTPVGKWRWPAGFARGGGRRANGGGGDGGRGGGRDTVATFALEGDRLTGKVTAFGQESEISKGSYQKGEIRFELIRDFRGQKTTARFRGKVDGDTLKGETESDLGGESRTRDWEATRVLEEAQSP